MQAQKLGREEVPAALGGGTWLWALQIMRLVLEKLNCPDQGSQGAPSRLNSLSSHATASPMRGARQAPDPQTQQVTWLVPRQPGLTCQAQLGSRTFCVFAKSGSPTATPQIRLHSRLGSHATPNSRQQMPFWHQPGMPHPAQHSAAQPGAAPLSGGRHPAGAAQQRATALRSAGRPGWLQS